jgi:hypothetical protein
MRRIGSRSLLVLLAAVLLTAAACGNDEEEQAQAPSTPAATSPPAPGPSVSITQPADGATVQAGDVLVRVGVQNLALQDKLGQPAKAGEGHIHYYIDIDPNDLPTDPAKPAVTDEPGTYAATSSTVQTWKDVKAGTHPLCAQLVDNDHTALDPAVTACVGVTVA